MWDDVTSEVDYRHKSNLLAAASSGTITFLMTGAYMYIASAYRAIVLLLFTFVCLLHIYNIYKAKDGINLQRDSFRFRRGEAVGILALYKHYTVYVWCVKLTAHQCSGAVFFIFFVF